MQRRRQGILIGILVMLVGVVMVGGTVLATDPNALTLEVLGRATLEAFRLQQHDFRVIAREENDVVIGELTIGVGGHTGWHTHPGPTFATVASGQVALTVLNKNGSCTTTVFGPGEGFAEGGGIVHIASTVGDVPAIVYVTFMAIPPRVDIPEAVIDWSPPAPRGYGCQV